jgi:hypothetical protein
LWKFERLLNSIYIIKQLKYFRTYLSIEFEFVLIFRVLFWLAQQRWKCIFKRRFQYIFCSELLLFVKKPTGMGFSTLKNFFSTWSLENNCFCKLCWKKQFGEFALPATARKSLPYKSAILWRQNFYWEKIGARILCLLFLWDAHSE